MGMTIRFCLIFHTKKVNDSDDSGLSCWTRFSIWFSIK